MYVLLICTHVYVCAVGAAWLLHACVALQLRGGEGLTSMTGSKNWACCYRPQRGKLVTQLIVPALQFHFGSCSNNNANHHQYVEQKAKFVHLVVKC